MFKVNSKGSRAMLMTPNVSRVIFIAKPGKIL